MNRSDITPFTERYFETTLWRLLPRLAPLIDFSRHAKPTPAQRLVLEEIAAPGAAFDDEERVWVGFTVLAKTLEAVPADELTDPETLLLAVTRLRQLMLTGEPDAEDDTIMGQVLFMTLSIGLLVGSVFGEDGSDLIGFIRQKEGADKGREKLVNKADLWREPVANFADEWFARRKPEKKSHGLISRCLNDFRKQHSEIDLPGSDGPARLVSRRLKGFLTSRGGS